MAVRWRYKIVPLEDAKRLIGKNKDCYIEVEMGSSPGYHIMSEGHVICRISKGSFKKLNGGLSDKQSAFINNAAYKIKQVSIEAI